MPPAFVAPAFALAELALASWETMLWRNWAVLRGTCPPAEFGRMAAEKAAAAWATGLALLRAGPSATLEDALSPWRRRAAANARRLRRQAW